MTMSSVNVHDDVPPQTQTRAPTRNSGVCRCGAVFDNGNVVIPLEYRGLCGRCAVARGYRIGVRPT